MANKLFSEFPAISTQEWKDKVKKDLKGKELSSLDWTIEEGITVHPFYGQESTEVLSTVPKAITQDWQIREQVLVEDVKVANQQAIDALMNGVDAPDFVLKTALTKADFEQLLNGIHLEMVNLYFSGEYAEKQAKDIITWLCEREVETEKIRLTISLCYSSPWLEIMAFAKLNLPQTKLLTAGPVSSDTPSQMVFEALFMGYRYMRKGNNANVSPVVVNDFLQFSMPVGSSYFVEIAKLRALRMLWLNVLKGYEVEASIPPIHAYTSIESQGENPYTNMLKGTTQAMSAVIAGVSSLVVTPSNASIEQPTAFSRRIARNVQHILKQESRLEHVIDPSEGSYYIETLTHEIAKKAWGLFQGKMK